MNCSLYRCSLHSHAKIRYLYWKVWRKCAIWKPDQHVFWGRVLCRQISVLLLASSFVGVSVTDQWQFNKATEQNLFVLDRAVSTNDFISLIYQFPQLIQEITVWCTKYQWLFLKTQQPKDFFLFTITWDKDILKHYKLHKYLFSYQSICLTA